MSKLNHGSLNWRVVIGIGSVHAIALLCPFFWNTSAIVLGGVLAILTGWLGVTLCYHRLLTHRSFKTPKWFEYVLTLCACLAWQGGPISWTGNHRLHHKHSDQDEDPHTPNHGFSWSHINWLFFEAPEGQDPRSVTQDLQRDRGIMLLDRFFFVPQILLAGILAGVGWWVGGAYTAIAWVAWGIGLRTVVVFHTTWFVNSACHTWGYQSHKTGDRSTNLWWVALLSGGEGWHNNHHADQRAANHGRRWWELDPTYWTIKLLERIGLAWDVKKAPAQ